MFRAVFIDEIKKFKNSTTDTEQLWNELAKRYGEAGRFYHTLHHLEHIFLDIVQVKNEINDWQTIVFAIAFHDVIYDPLRNDNEERSAAFAETQLRKAGSPIGQTEKCKEHILATKTHQLSHDPDTNYFIDADLAILGADPNLYLSYSENIRREYSHYPEYIYNAGRKKVIMHFLDMHKIFKTKHFHQKYGAQSIINLTNELQKL